MIRFFKYLPLLAFLFLGHLVHAQYIAGGIVAKDHNRKRPLIDALTYQFAGIEAQITLKKDGRITCGSLTLSDTYLNPLKEKSKQNGGQIYSNRTEEFLVILELNSDPILILPALEKELESYAEMLSEKNGDVVKRKAVRICITGKALKEPGWTIRSPYVFLIDEFNKPGNNGSDEFYTLALLNFKRVYDWNGVNNMPNMQYHSLSSLMKVAHKAGRRVFMTDIPNTTNSWDIFLGAGADYLEVTDLDAFVTFWRNRKTY